MNEHADNSETRALRGGNLIAIAAVVITIIGGAFTYVATSANISATVQVLQKRADTQSQDIKDAKAQLQADATSIAVIDTQYTYVTQQLADLKQEMDEVKQDIEVGGRKR